MIKPKTIRTVEDKTAPSLIFRSGAKKKPRGGAQKRQKEKTKTAAEKKIKYGSRRAAHLTTAPLMLRASALALGLPR
jgi:hypothetical protein